MKVTDRVDHERTFRCTCCGWEGTDSEFTSEDEEGNDLCPACGGTEFEEVEGYVYEKSDIEKLPDGTKVTIYYYKLIIEEDKPKIIIEKHELTKQGFALEHSPRGWWLPATEENHFRYDARCMYSRDANKKDFFIEKCKEYLEVKYLEHKNQADFLQGILNKLKEN